ncbi:hypothetical protein evm_003932 [Chilo suppressalis]|nr:hypothetical protein evm_003932 [Chilo suppressalis]
MISAYVRTAPIHGGTLIFVNKNIKTKDRKDIVGLSVERIIELSCVEFNEFIILSRGEVIGGYCEAAWGSAGAGGYVAAPRGFLFTLGSPPSPPATYPLVKKPFALCSHPDCGPIFGAGADLLISNNCNTNSDSYSNLHSYGADPAPPSLAPDYNFTVRDYELFTPKHN